MPDDQSPPLGSVGEPGDEIDPALLAALQRALSELDFLRPEAADPRSDAPSDTGPMPDDVWQRLTLALDAEHGHPEHPVGGSTRRWTRWAGGLVAASVAILAVGLGVTTFSGSDNGGGEALVAQDDGSAADAAAAPAPMLSFAGMVPPAISLVDSNTDYRDSSLKEQVTQVLDGMGMKMTRMKQEMSAPPVELEVPAVPAVAVLETPRSLRDCITKLTEVATSTALLVDWSYFNGQDAGVVVAPDYVGPDQDTPDLTELDVWVIDPDCDVRVSLHMSMP